MVDRIATRYADKDFDDLPVEVQNTMQIGGGGGGHSWRSWSGAGADNNTD